MNFKQNPNKFLFFSLIFYSIIMAGVVMDNWPHCDSIDSVESHLVVREENRHLIGFNTNTDSLNFGEVSAGGIVQRSIIVDNEAPANVYIKMDSAYENWTTIIPSRFFLEEGEVEEVKFKVKIPNGEPFGNYSGNVYFCFVE